MFRLLFPKQIDNTYRGLWLAVWLFVPLVSVKAVQGANSIIMTHEVMVNADGIPVDSYGPAGAQAAIGLFALLGMYLLILPLQSLIVLIRYRAAIPLMYLSLVLVQIASRFVVAFRPIDRLPGTSIGFTINVVLLVLVLIGLALSVTERRALQ